MKLKPLAACIALTCASGVAVAQDYQFELGVNYTDIDIDNGPSEDSFGAYGIYHFTEVNVGQQPLAEAAFITRSSNAYVYGSNDLDVVTGGVEFYIPDTIFYVAGEITRTDFDGQDTENDWGVRAGITPVDGLLLYTTYYDEPGYDANIHAKYVAPLGGSTFVNLEGGYTDADEGNAYYAFADYYFDQTLSVGVGFESDELLDDTFTVRARKFFTPVISGDLSFYKNDYFDGFTIGASFRF